MLLITQCTEPVPVSSISILGQEIYFHAQFEFCKLKLHFYPMFDWDSAERRICYGNLVLVASCNTSILKYPLPYWHFARLKVLLYSSLTSRASVFSRTKLKVLQRIYSVIQITFVLIISWLIANLGPGFILSLGRGVDKINLSSVNYQDVKGFNLANHWINSCN